MPDDVIKAAPNDNPYSLSFEELSFRDSYLYPDSMFSPWNPDDLVQKHQDYSIYEEMLKDDQVSVCLKLKKDLVLSSGFDFIAQEDGHADIIQDLKIAIVDDPAWAFEEMLEEVMSAYEFGFSVSEKVFKKRKDGRVSLSHIKTRYPGTWMIHTDERGNYTRYEQQGTKTNLDVPKEVLIHFINNRRFQNPYGVSDLRAAYQAWFTKKHITRWYAIFIERSASPVPIGRYDKQATNTAVDDIYNALKRFQTKTALVIPKYIEVEFLEAKSDGEAFVKGLGIFNTFIGRSLLIPDLMGFAGSETQGGSYSLGKEQMEVFYRHIKRRRIALERIINDEIVWPIILHNFGYVDNYPRFKFRDISQEQIVESAKLWLEAVRSQVYRPAQEELDHFKSIVNFPVTESDEEDDGVPSLEADEKTDVVMLKTSDGDYAAEKKERKYNLPSGPYSKKTDFDLVEKTLDTALDAFLATSKKTIEDILGNFLDEVDRKKILQREKLDKLDSLELKRMGSFRKQLLEATKDLYYKSQEIISTELFKSNFAKPILSEEFLKLLATEIDLFMGDWEHNVTKATRTAIIAAIKDRKSIAELVGFFEKETKRKAFAAIETFARTKFTEVMNKGRMTFFEGTGIAAGYQYAAILDDRTTDLCRGLNSKTFKKGEAPIPPLHFNALVEGTLIKTADGDKAIESIKIGDLVFTHKGRYCRVYDVMSKFEDKEYFDIEFRDSRTSKSTTLQITGEHPILTERGWVRADELSTTDKVISTKYIRPLVAGIVRKNIVDQKLYNLAVEQYESYVANGIFVHNCRSVLVPITIYEEFTPDEFVGKTPINDFIEENKGAGFPIQ